MLNNTWKTTALAGLAFGLAHNAGAATLVYEGFQYSDVGDDLDNVTTVDVAPDGLTGGWTENFNNVEMFLKAGSLNFSNLPTAGNHIGYLSNSSNDLFTQSLDGTATAGIGSASTIYISFLFEKLQSNFGADHEGLALMNGILPQTRWDNNNGGAVGRHGFAIAAVNNSNLNAIAYDGTTGTRVVSTNTISTPSANGSSNTSGSNLGDVKLIVAEISFNTGTGGADVMRLYSVADDGSLDAGDLTLVDTIEADVDESTLNTLNITRQVNVNYDEIRITTTLDEALGVPEPGSLALLGLGGLLVARRRRG